MGLKKGMTNNPAGKPPGTKNKINSELRGMINDFLESKFEMVVADFETLEPKDKLKFYTDLLSYGLPKLQAASIDIDLNEVKLGKDLEDEIYI